MIIKQNGGMAVVQDPADSLHPGMPSSALEQVEVDHVVPVSQMAGLLERLVNQPAAAERGGSRMKHQEAESPDPATGLIDELEHEALTGPPSSLTCPECGGALWELVDGSLICYRCHVGHAYSAENMVTQQAQSIESALWAARFAASETDAGQGADVIRQLVLTGVDDVPALEEA